MGTRVGAFVIFNQDVTNLNNELSRMGEMESVSSETQADKPAEHKEQSGQNKDQDDEDNAGASSNQGAQPSFKAIEGKLKRSLGADSNRNRVQVEDVEARASALGAM